MIKKFFFLVLLFCWHRCVAQPGLTVRDNKELVTWNKNVFYLIDSSGSRTFSEVGKLPDAAFHFEPSSKMSFGNSEFSWWFKMYINNESSEDLYLLFHNHEIQVLDIYLMDSSHKVDSIHSGISRQSQHRYFENNTPVFKLGRNAAVVFLRIRTPIFYLPVKIGTIQPVVKELHGVDVFNIFIIGLMLALTIYNLVIFAFTKDRVHLYYFAYIISSVYIIAHSRGYVQEFFPGVFSILARHGNLLGSMVAIFSILFTISYLDTRRRALFFHKWLLLLIILNMLLLFTELLPYKSRYNVWFQLLHLSLMPAMLGAGIYVYFKKYKPALYYLLAFSIMKAGVTLSLGGYLGWFSYNNFFIQNAYYIGAALEALVLSLAIAYRFNAYKKEAYEKKLQLVNERNRIMADLHDDVGASLSSMHIYGDLAKNVWETKPLQSREMIEKISATSKDLMQRMGDIIWSMKPADEEKYTLEGRLKNYSNELLAAKDIVCTFDIDNKLAASVKDPEIKKNIMLIAKEAINNIAKYSGAGKASVVFCRREESIVLIISDDGKGLDEKMATVGNGLVNITNRCRQLQGICKIDSAMQKGVVITCVFPLTIISYGELD